MTRLAIPPGLRGRAAGPRGDHWGQERKEGEEGTAPLSLGPSWRFAGDTRQGGVTASEGLGRTPPQDSDTEWPLRACARPCSDAVTGPLLPRVPARDRTW